MQRSGSIALKSWHREASSDHYKAIVRSICVLLSHYHIHWRALTFLTRSTSLSVRFTLILAMAAPLSSATSASVTSAKCLLAILAEWWRLCSAVDVIVFRKQEGKAPIRSVSSSWVRLCCRVACGPLIPEAAVRHLSVGPHASIPRRGRVPPPAPAGQPPCR